MAGGALQFAFAAAVAALALAAPAGARAQDLEAAVKAAFLTRFPTFVTGLPAANELQVCMVGEDPFGRAVERSAAGRVAVRRLAAVNANSGCHVLFVTGSARQSVREALDAVAGARVLTVTDSAAGQTRGMIHFVVAAERVRFHIDTVQARRSNLQMSSKLLALALSVRR